MHREHVTLSSNSYDEGTVIVGVRSQSNFWNSPLLNSVTYDQVLIFDLYTGLWNFSLSKEGVFGVKGCQTIAAVQKIQDIITYLLWISKPESNRLVGGELGIQSTSM